MNGRPSRDAFSGVGNKCTKTRGQKQRGSGKQKTPPLSGAEGYLFFEFLVFLVEPGNVAQFSEQATSLRSLLINLSQRLLVVLFVNIYLLSDRKQVEHEIVKIQAGWEAIEEKLHLLRIVFVFRAYVIHHRMISLHSHHRLHTGLGQRMEGYFENNRKNY